MKHASLVKAVEKAGFKVKNEEGYSTRFYAENGNAQIDWVNQKGEVVCLHQGRKTDRADSMSDYFPGTFSRTMKLAVDHLKLG